MNFGRGEPENKDSGFKKQGWNWAQFGQHSEKLDQ